VSPVWAIFMAKNSHKTTNIIAKQDNFFLEEEILNSSWHLREKHTLVSWHNRFQHFNLQAKSSACFLDRFKSRMI
jgi:hypothetical protein